MPDAVTLAEGGRVPQNNERRVVLVTGAAGNIGSYFAEHNRDRYDLRLMVHEKDGDVLKLQAFGKVLTGDITKLDDMKRVCAGVHTVVHMAGDPSPNATWGDLLQANIIGTYNTFVAALSQGCKRVIYASSIHAVSGYPADVQVKTNDPVNPGDLYGVSKCFGEALARYMAEQEGLSSIALRIGAFQPPEKARDDMGVKMLDAWVSHRDLDQLIRLCVDAEGVQFAIFNGLSDNRFKRLDISNAREILGYKPLDNVTQENPELRPLRLEERVMAHNLQDPGVKSGLREEL
jgi:NAD(P)-dependent dehydrogenase (short-subunit alcohol dehydrogenase family)